MSMVHSSYVFDWRTYRSKVNGPARDPQDVEAWQAAVHGVLALCKPGEIATMPDWKQELIRLHFEEVEAVLAPRKKETLEHVRDLHLLAILWCCVEPGEGYGQTWDVLKEGLRHELGTETGDDLVLGRHWEGGAWDFVPDVFTYQFGFLEGDLLKRAHAKAGALTEDRLAAALKDLDLKETYPVFKARLEPDEIPWVVEAFRQLQRNLARATRAGHVLFYALE